MSGFLQFNDPLPPEEEVQALVLVRKDPTLAQIIIPMSPFQPFSIFSNIFGSDRILLKSSRILSGSNLGTFSLGLVLIIGTVSWCPDEKPSYF